MPIVVSCACGKQFRAPDSSAGRRGKCPGCGGPLQVPALPTPAAEADLFAALSVAVTDRSPLNRLPPVPTGTARATAPARPSASRPPAQRPAAVPVTDDAGNDPDHYGAYDLKPGSAATRTSRPPSWPRPGATASPSADTVDVDDGDETSDYDSPYASASTPALTPAPRRAMSSPPAAPGGRGRPHGLLYLVLVVALVPLAWSVLTTHADETLDERMGQTLAHAIEAHPEIRAKLKRLTEVEDAPDASAYEQLLNLVPDHKLDGALLSRDSKVHWLYAALSGGLFFVGTLVVLPKASARVKHLLMTGLFTGTIGILLLLGVQLAAQMTYGRMFAGRSIVVLIFYLIKFIGFSYHAANDPDTNLFVSLFGFTFGVGMCEELCKALPVIFVLRAGQGMTWRDACRWGFNSGVGFGVSEGIMYCGDYYNGYEGGGMYLVRFVSCVSLQAVWTAAAGITLFRRQNLLHDAEHWFNFLLNLVVLLIVPMLLHGLYDTLLKKDHEAMALGVAVASVGWLAWNVEKMLRAECDDPRFAAAMA